MRRGREFYGKKYGEAVKLYNEGKTVNQIAALLNVSYSAAYHWIKGIRKPDAGKINEFERFLCEKGPQPAEEIKDFFPKHNELFLIASRRGRALKRVSMSRELKGYSVWYFLEGQEAELEKRTSEMLSKVKKFKDKLSEIL